MFKSSKTKKSQNAQKSETIKLILKNLSNQYSLKEVIDCVFSSPSKNKELKTIMEFLLKEEGKLKIIQYLLHIGDSANNIEENTDFQDMDDSLENINSIRPRLRKRKIPTVYSVSSSKSSNKSEEENNNALFNPIFLKNKISQNKKIIDDEIKEINLIEKEEKEENIPSININLANNGSDITTLELNEKKQINDNNKQEEEEILILDDNNNNILNEIKPKKIEEEKILEINFNEINNPETIIKSTSIKDKIIEIPLNENDNDNDNIITTEKKEINENKKEENNNNKHKEEKIKDLLIENKNIEEKEEIKEIKENKDKKDLNICLSSSDENSIGIQIQEENKDKTKKEKNIKNLESIFIPNNGSLSLKVEPTKPKNITLSNITDFLSKKRNFNLDDNEDNIYLKYYYTIDNGKFYKYKIISEEIGIANLICDDYRCNGKGMYIIQDKMFNIVSRHNILNAEHSYVQNMSKIDKEYFDNMKNNKKFGIEVNVRKIK